MRFVPAALALSLLVAVTSSVGYGAERAPNPAAVRLAQEGQQQLAAGKVQEATDSFEAALAVDPSYTALYLHLAEAARQQGLQGKAIRYYREALDRDPGMRPLPHEVAEALEPVLDRLPAVRLAGFKVR